MVVRLRWLALVFGALVLLLGVQHAQSAPTELFISEYIEGSWQNKTLEIYNGTGAPVDLGASAPACSSPSTAGLRLERSR